MERKTTVCPLPTGIDDQFIKTWHPRYDETECDEPEYQRLLVRVSSEITARHTLTRLTFEEILNWKAARVKGIIDWDNFSDYSYKIKKSLEESDQNKMTLLTSLRGIGAPVASTFLHFIYPNSFPIFDQRTVGVLRYFRYIYSKSTELAQYPAFRSAVLKIQASCPEWSLREIDRAVFAFHKLNDEIFGTLSKPSKTGYHRSC